MRRVLVVVVSLLLVTGVGVGLWAFEPWRLVTSSTVDEPLPIAGPAPSSPRPTPEGRDPEVREGRAGLGAEQLIPVEGPEPVEPEPVEPEPVEPEPVELASGRFEDAEHGTTGTARVIELADGRRFVRLEALDSSDGPDLHVWVTDQPSGGEWGSYDDGRYVRLGELTATNGNQNYGVPADADLRGLTSVVIWCDRFDVAFGTAPVAL